MSQITSIMPEGRQRYYNNDGTPCAGGLLYTYAAGTTNPKATYADADGNVQNPNPVPLDAHGEAVVYWNGAYKVDLKQADGQQVTGYPVDNLRTDPAGIWGITAQLLAQLAQSTGAALIGYVQAGAGAVARVVQAKIVELPSAADYGATDDGITDDSAAESAALTQATSGRSLLRSLWMYKFPGRGVKAWKRTFGTKDQATVVSINDCDETSEPVTQVSGFVQDSDVSTYSSRDKVALFVQTTARPALLTTANTTFTANSVTSADFAAIIGKVKRGMMIDTGEATKKTGFVTGVNAATNTISVGAWYVIDGSRGTGTPAAGTQVTIDPNTKVWALNANVTIPANAMATDAAGFELGLLNQKTDHMGYLYDAVNLGPKIGTNAFQARQGGAAGWDVGFAANPGCAIGHQSIGNALGFKSSADSIGLLVENNKGVGIRFTDATGTTVGEMSSNGRHNIFRLYYGVFANGATIGANTVVCSTAATAVAITVNLPGPAVPNNERVLYLKNPKTSTANVTFAGTVEDGTGSIIVTPGSCVMVLSDNSKWIPISKY